MTPWQRLRVSWSAALGHWLLGGALLALAAGLFDPGWTTRRALYEQIVVLDVTQSMNVQDQRLDGRPVSRIELARRSLRAALTALPCGSKLGWAIFSEHRSFLLFAPVEVCANLSELRSTLAQIDNRMAWSGDSEIAKGLHSAFDIARALPQRPTLVFVTDGHEAPPLNPHYRPAFDDEPGEVPGLIVGVGGSTPVPIPKSDPLGRPIGWWDADEVQQTDPRSRGRGASVGGESMVDDRADQAADGRLGGTPGREHLSALRETYLRLLAGERGMAYLHLDEPQALATAMMNPALARPVEVRASGRPLLAGLALLLLVARHLLPLAGALRRRLQAQRSSNVGTISPIK